MNRLKSPIILTLTALLVMQAAAAYYLDARHEAARSPVSLAALPRTAGPWMRFKDIPMEQEVQDVLKADDTLITLYKGPFPDALSLYIAFFRSQRSGVAPHSPKNCLPGSGWVSEKSDVIRIEPVGGYQPIEVNRYVVQKGDMKTVAIYWYQSRDRVVANEYKAKLFVVADAMRYNRTDTSLVRVMAPVINNDVDAANKAAIDLSANLYGQLLKILPQ